MVVYFDRLNVLCSLLQSLSVSIKIYGMFSFIRVLLQLYIKHETP